MKALVFRTNGEIEIAEMPEPETEQADWLRQKVGGWLEGIKPWRRLAGDWFAYCDEEGKLKNYPLNHGATTLAREAGWLPGDVLCGTVVFVGVNGTESAAVPEQLLRLAEELFGD